jgi:hypothetical protein
MSNRIIHVSADQLALLAHVLAQVDPDVVTRGFEQRDSFFSPNPRTELVVLQSGINDAANNPSSDPKMVYGLNM